MNSLISNNLIRENRDNQNISYILQEDTLFFQTGYKVLQNQAKNGFIKCVKVTHNGKIKLVYDISKYKTLKSVINSLRQEEFLTVIAKLLNVACKVKDNGFMQCENINISFDKVFIDSNDYSVFLLYVPVNIDNDIESIARFEKELKNNIIKAILENDNLNSDIISQLTSDLTSENYSLEELEVRVNGLNINVSEISSPSFSIDPHHQQEKELNSNSFRNNYEEDGEKVKVNLIDENSSLINNDSNPIGSEFTVKDSDNNSKINSSSQTYVKNNISSNISKYQTSNDKPNKANNLKILLIIICQVLTLAAALAIIFVLNLQRSTNIGAVLALIGIDILISVFVGVYAFNEKVDTINPVVNETPVFHQTFEGGATEILDDIFRPTIVLSGIKTPQLVEIIINSPDFVIGKNSEQSDAVISFNKAISRKHCKITFNNNKYYISDMGSSNGTYVNNLKITEGQQVPIEIGDNIRLANSEFVIKPYVFLS